MVAFILKGLRRINLMFVKEYKPKDKSTSIGADNYMIEFTYNDGKKDEFDFSFNKKKRDKVLNKLDNICLKLNIDEKD
jgi:hypothetical protein